MWPWLMFLNPNFRIADQNVQAIDTRFASPTVVNVAGNLEIEAQVQREVATYGRQLGWLIEALLAEIDKQPDAGADAVAKLRKARAAIDGIKEQHRLSALDEANVALERLAKESPEAYEALVAEKARALTRSSRP